MEAQTTMKALLAVFFALVAPVITAAEVSLGPETPLAPNSIGKQTGVRIAVGTAGLFAVWIDGDTRIAASIRGNVVTVADADPVSVYSPEIAVGNQDVLVIWRQWGPNNPLMARRLDLAGNPVDAQPLRLDVDSDDTAGGASIAVSFDGSSFLVAWGTSKQVQGPSSSFGTLNSVRIGEQGEPFDRRETPMPASSPRAVWTGSGFILGYWVSNFGVDASGITGGPPGIAVVRDGAPSSSELAAPTFRSLTMRSQFAFQLAATDGPETVTFAWSGNGIQAVQTTLTGKALRQPFVIVPQAWYGPWTKLDIAWNGSEYLLAWNDIFAGGKLMAIRVGANMERIDDYPIELASNLGEFTTPAVARTPAGAVIAYSRSESPGGPLRAFMRQVDRLPSPGPPRRRVTGR
jgi:hypothetical protein